MCRAHDCTRRKDGVSKAEAIGCPHHSHSGLGVDEKSDTHIKHEVQWAIRVVGKNKARQPIMCVDSTCRNPRREHPIPGAGKATVLGLEMDTLCTLSPTP